MSSQLRFHPSHSAYARWARRMQYRCSRTSNFSSLSISSQGKVTFQYTESRRGETKTRTLHGEDFLWLLLQHVLPMGFRRVRDYGFLHGNAKRRLMLVQLVLKVMLQAAAPRPRPMFLCPKCRSPMAVVAVCRPAWTSG